MMILPGGISMKPRRKKTAMRPKPARAWPPTIGDNGGPPLDEPTPPWRGGDLLTYFAWEAACDRAWGGVPYDIMMLRMRRAEALGLTYRAYTLEIMERGRYLSKDDLKD